MQRADSLEKTLMLGKIEGKRRRGWEKMRWLNSIINSVDVNLSKLWETVEDRRAWHAAVQGVTKSWTLLKRLNNNNKYISYISIKLEDQKTNIILNEGSLSQKTTCHMFLFI